MSQSDDNQILYSVRIDIPPEIRLYVIQLLQQTLACTVDLRSQVKQACWNVKGHDLVLLHALFATMATELDAHTDLVAERLVVLGGVARGTVRTAATHSRMRGVRRSTPTSRVESINGLGSWTRTSTTVGRAQHQRATMAVKQRVTMDVGERERGGA